MKAKELNESVWGNEESHLVITKIKGGYHLDFMEYDKVIKTAKDVFSFLKKENFNHMSWD